MLLQLSNRIPGLPDIDCGVADYLETCNLLKIVGGTDSCASQFPWLVRASALSCCPSTIVNYNAKGVSVVFFFGAPNLCSHTVFAYVDGKARIFFFLFSTFWKH